MRIPTMLIIVRKILRNTSSGLTSVEVMVGIAIVLVLMAIALPYIMGLLRSASVSTQAHQFVSSLNFARSEAIKRNQRVTVCKSMDGVRCTTNGSWEQGWIVFVDRVNSAQVTDSFYILGVLGPLRGETTLTGNTPVRNYISYVGNGSTQLISGAFQAGTVRLCRQKRGVNFVIARAGRIRTESVVCP